MTEDIESKIENAENKITKYAILEYAGIGDLIDNKYGIIDGPKETYEDAHELYNSMNNEIKKRSSIAKLVLTKLSEADIAREEKNNQYSYLMLDEKKCKNLDYSEMIRHAELVKNPSLSVHPELCWNAEFYRVESIETPYIPERLPKNLPENLQVPLPEKSKDVSAFTKETISKKEYTCAQEEMRRKAQGGDI